MAENLEIESRDNKRRRSQIEGNDIRKMEILKEWKDEHTDNVVEETRVISGLIEKIEDEKVRALIECFGAGNINNIDIIKQQMMKCSDEWIYTMRKDIYIGAINYIVHGRKDGKEKEEQMQEFEIEELREILIREIENRMPTHCETCKQWYIVKLRDTPDIHCMWCRIGIHDCIELNEVKNIQGI